MKPVRELYVGYRSHAPAGTARFIGTRIAGVLVISLLLAVLITLAQERFANATFEYGTLRSFAGIISESPYPTLLVARPGRAAVPYSRYLLVAPGKHGFAQASSGLHGRRVSLRGTLIHRDAQTMIEAVPASLKLLNAGAVDDASESLGNVTLRGEIVDSKCFLGVMKPGETKVHRACAIRCLSGGIPALFVIRDADGTADYLLLAGADGRALNKDILHLVAEPVAIEGELVRMGSELVLRTNVSAIRRLN